MIEVLCMVIVSVAVLTYLWLKYFVWSLSALMFSHVVQILCMVIVSVAVLTYDSSSLYDHYQRCCSHSHTAHVLCMVIHCQRCYCDNSCRGGGGGGRVIGGGGAESLSQLFYVSPYQ